MIIDYATLKLIWWFFIVALFVLFFIWGGRDFGACILLPWVGKDDLQRRLVISSIIGTWEGNQVWFITAGGATFAAWPLVYATAFSGLYYAFLLVLLTLILRPPGFDYRSKLKSNMWRQGWDYALFLSGIVPSFVFGVALGNLFLGLPFYFDETMRSHYQGSFIQLLTPFTLLFGLAAVTLLSFHGALFLQEKVGAHILTRLKGVTVVSAIVFIVSFIALGFWIKQISGYHVSAMPDVNSTFLPMAKTVDIQSGAWLANYAAYPKLWLLPISTLVMTILALILSLIGWAKTAYAFTSGAIITSLGTAGVALFPFILASSSQPNHGLTVWDSTSSHLTLFYMFIVAVIFLPIILGYTMWVFRVLRGRVEATDVFHNNESL